MDDDPNFINITRRVLEREDYDVDTALGGEEAITKIYAFEPEVVILDVLMPQLSGIETIKIIKGWKPDLKVIVVSALKTISDDFIQYGAFTFLQKPIAPDLLHSTIESALRQGENPVL